MHNFTPLCKICITLIESLNEQLGRAVSWLTALMVLVTFAVVLLRYAFDIGWIAMQESVAYMHAMVFMLGAAYTLKHDSHVRVDIFYQHCSITTKAWIDIFGTLLLLLPVAGLIAWNSWDYVVNAWEIRESSRNSGGLPGIFLIKSCIPLMALLLALQGLALLLKNVLILINADPILESDHG